MHDDYISYYVHEAIVARFERSNKRLWVLCIIIFLSFVISNGAWIYYESQFAVTEQEVEQDIDTGNGDAIITGIGDIYGESKAESQN